MEYKSVRLSQSMQSLSEEFFQEIVELENQLNTQFNLEGLRKLVVLYSKAVEYYEIRGDSKFKDYSERITLVLKEINQNLEIANKKGEKKLEQQLKKKENKRILSQKYNLKDKEAVFKRSEMLLNAMATQSYTDGIFKDTIAKQSENFKDRLAAKRKIKLSKSDIEKTGKQHVDNKKKRRRSQRGIRPAEEESEGKRLNLLRETLEDLTVLKRDKKRYDTLNEIISKFRTLHLSNISNTALNRFVARTQVLVRKECRAAVEAELHYETLMKETEMVLMVEENVEARSALDEMVESWKNEKMAEVLKITERYDDSFADECAELKKAMLNEKRAKEELSLFVMQMVENNL